MINAKHVALLLGFAFVAVWLARDFGDAILCLAGALLFYVVAAVLSGDLDLTQFQSRFK